MVISMKRGNTVLKVAESQVETFKLQGYEVVPDKPAPLAALPSGKSWTAKDVKVREDRLSRAGAVTLVRGGHQVTCEHAQVPAMRAAGWVEPHEVKAESEGRGILLKLDPKDESLWAEDGRPKIEGLRKVLSLPKLTMKDVAAVWPEFSREALLAEQSKGA